VPLSAVVRILFGGPNRGAGVRPAVAGPQEFHHDHEVYTHGPHGDASSARSPLDRQSEPIAVRVLAAIFATAASVVRQGGGRAAREVAGQVRGITNGLI
jgi:hypothetical protein